MKREKGAPHPNGDDVEMQTVQTCLIRSSHDSVTNPANSPVVLDLIARRTLESTQHKNEKMTENAPPAQAASPNSNNGTGASTGNGPTGPTGTADASNQNGSTAGPVAGQNAAEQSQSQEQSQNQIQGINTNRGLPYYEKLRRELRDTLQKKRLMDKSMAQLEDQIYRFEQSYLEETTAGNIIKGFDNYIKGSSTGSTLTAGGISLTGAGLGTGAGAGAAAAGGGGGGGGAARRKAPVTDSDRVFSRSSAGFMRDSPTPSSTQTTPSHAPTPTGNDMSAVNGNSKAGSSKNKKKSGGNKGSFDEDVEDSDKPPMKRLKISYGRD